VHAVWLTRWAGGEGDPSLRLKGGSAQDDKGEWHGRSQSKGACSLACALGRLTGRSFASP